VTARGAYPVLALAAFTVSLAAPVLPRAPFAAYFGPLPAPVAMALVAGAGLAAAARLERAGWTRAGWTPRPLMLRLVALGAAFALPTIGLDIALPFPDGINAPLPEALAFYPAIGVVAETVFHLLPFALLSLVMPTRPAVAIVVCALVEPAFQVAAGGAFDLQGAVMAAILFAFGLAQMRALHRHGFAAAFALRIGYYLIWHIVWGAARLPLLYPS
jgi:hypothetical protein